jgi:hypothetical protein
VNPRAGLDAVVKKKSLFPPVIEPGRPAHCLITIPTELLRLIFFYCGETGNTNFRFRNKHDHAERAEQIGR